MTAPALGRVHHLFGGHFVGRNAEGPVFSTFLLTDAASTASGVHLYTRPSGP